MASRLTLEIVDGVAFVTLDEPGRAVNTLAAAALEDFAGVLGQLESSSGLIGVVLISAKPRNFLSGADLEELDAMSDPARASRLVAQGQELLDRWRQLAVPTVAAIQGAALGGGLEVALACTWRVASQHPSTRLGLPEVQLGLIPALGGTYYLPRRVGLKTGLDLLLSGRRLGARQAEKIGLVDEAVHPSELREAALRWLGKGARREPGRLGDRLLGGNRMTRSWLVGAARRRVEHQTGGHYPAPLRILEAVEVGLAEGVRAALARERRHFAELAGTAVCRNLVSLFLASRKLAGAVEEERAELVLAVVGAGFMGSGIAAAAARSGHHVLLMDESAEALESAMEFARGRFESLVRRHKMDRREAKALAERITPSRGPVDLERVDLAVEAVFESLEVKRPVLRRLDEGLPPSAVIGSNTSTIPIARLAEDLAHPERLLGLHFFSPVHRMPLVEIVRHRGTSVEAVAAAQAFVRSLGKTPLVVHDGPGFFTSRILAPYLAQGAQLLLEGATVQEVDGAARAAGFPVGPLELLDEVGLDIAAQAAGTLARAYPERMPYPQPFRRLVEEGRLGRKSRRGFYDYRGKRKRPDPELGGLLGTEASPRRIDRRSAADRLLLAMAIEAVRCLEEGIVDGPRDGDVGAVLGLGFPPFRGGPFRYLDDLGAQSALARSEELTERHGEVFEPPQLLRQKALKGEGFHVQASLSRRARRPPE